MNPGIKARWVAALRSGEYRQGQGRLRYQGFGGNDEFCCLGVLCELASQDGILSATKHLNGRYTYAGEVTYLPIEVIDWAGLRSKNPAIDIHGIHSSLGSFNDNGVPFDVIAEAIDTRL